ncbi:MAG: hypothetical protein JNM09_00245 [Blastocatellia bacterium]|nr:hypothetical protein [Blastocatellia bacterium]
MKRFLHPITIGLLLTALLFPTVTVQAQWTVYDPVASVHAIQQLQQWVAAIQKYETMIQNGMEQVTNLRSIMQQGEKMLLQYKISEWGKLIRLGFQLKWQVANLLTAQGRIFMGIQRRALNGILNPEQDLAEFERYLEYSIGRTAENEIYKTDQAIRADKEIQVIKEHNAQLSTQTAEFEQAIQSNEDSIQELMNCDNCPERDVQIQALKIQNDNLRTKQQAALKEFREQEEKLNKRVEAIRAVHNKGKMFGKEIEGVNKAWEDLSRESEETLTLFSKSRQARQ